MENCISENVVLYDWLSFTTRKHTPEEVIEALGLSHCSWTELSGARGYLDRLYFGSISIHYNGREDMGVWCEMSGQGCRNFEDLSTLPGKWETLFRFIHDNCLHITRLDVAFDDHTGLLNIDTVAQDTEQQRFVSRMNFWEVVRSSKGTSIQIGSPQSKVRIRIYDKAAERGYDDGRHWVRVELQLRDGRAEEFSRIPMDVVGIVRNFFQIVISIVVGMAAGCIPIAGYNMGAEKRTRVRVLFTHLLIAEALVGAVALLFAEGFPRQLIAIFGAANESVYYTDFAVRAFRIYLCMMVLACVNKACFIFLQAMGKALASTLLSLLREVVFGVGFALVLPLFFGLSGVLYSMPVSDVLTFIASAYIIVKTYRELNAEGAQEL